MNKPRSFIGRLFGGLWSLLVGIYRALVILFVLVSITLIWFSVRGTPIHVEDNIALVIKPSGQLIDDGDHDSQALIDQLNGEPPSFTAVRDMVDALEAGAKDSRITAAVLKLDDMEGAGMAQIEEIATAVAHFRASGKPVYAHGGSFTQPQYLLAVNADQISIDPMGQIMLTGLGVYTNYFKDALDKLGVSVNVFRVGEFKSAVEPFERNDMSPEARTANEAWLKDLWKSYDDRIAAARKLQGAPATDYVAGLSANLQKLKGDSATYAKTAGLVDQIETIGEFRKRVGQKVGMDKHIGSFRQINAMEYLRAARQQEHHSGPGKIAVITVEGEIIKGRSKQNSAGGDTISELLDQARRDDNVDAVVLHVNSPGGSVDASEQIRRAVHALQDEGTPVVVSMSNLAASGGYWISMDADEIWAHETTITGSIGIFGLWPTIDKPLEKLGIHTDGVGTTPLAGALRIDRPLSPDVRTMIQSQINFGYRQFITGVSQGRDLPPEKVEEIARGRVWSGSAAKQLGLVDKIGDLKQAIASAAKLADLKEGEYEVEDVEPPRNFFREFMGGLTGQGQSRAALEAGLRELNAPGVDEALALGKALSHFNDPRGEYAYCFCSVAETGQH